MPPADDAAAAALTVSEVAVRFGGVAALNEASLTVDPGTVTGLIGPNGAGKTTLFNVISGLQAPDRGSVSIFDTDVTSMRPHLRARQGLARTFQRLEVFGSLTVSENVQVGLESSARWWNVRRHHRSISTRVESEPRVEGSDPLGGKQGNSDPLGGDKGTGTGEERLSTAAMTRYILEVAGLTGVAHRQSSNLPTGVARMVELARALAIRPRLLLLDEPGSGLDEGESAVLGRLLTRLAASGMAVLLVEHDMELVMRICDPIYVLDFGDVICSGRPDEVRSDSRVQAAYLGEGGEGGAFGDGSSRDAGVKGGAL